MVICEFKEGQGLGNQLWNYAVVRSVANKLSMNFSVIGYEFYKGKFFLDLDLGQPLINQDFYIFNETLYYDDDIKYISSGFDERILNIQFNTKLVGLFQSEKYFFGSNVKLFFNTSKLNYNNLITARTCILNIRGGEYKLHKRFLLPKSYWLYSMKMMESKFNIDNFIIVTDDKKYSKSLFPNLHIISNDIEMCFSAIFQCNYIIVSNSTFSYFPIKLSDSKKIIYAPKYWARFNDDYNRWASPANIYEGWYWISKYNTIESYEDCLKIAIQTEDYYKKTFFISSNYNPLNNKFLRNILSPNSRLFIKKLLSYILPKHFG